MDDWPVSERYMACLKLVGVLSAIYDSCPEAFPPSYRPEVKRMLKIAMPTWKPVEEE